MSRQKFEKLVQRTTLLLDGQQTLEQPKRHGYINIKVPLLLLSIFRLRGSENPVRYLYESIKYFLRN